MQLSDNLKGAAFMCGAMAGFGLNDAAVKIAAADIGLYQAIFIRGAMATAILFAFVVWQGALFSVPSGRDAKLLSARALADVLATLCFLTALMNMELANITAILQILPLTVALAAAWVFGEAIGWRRGVAIFIGMIGTLLIVRPGTDGFNTYTLLGLGAVACVTGRDIIARSFSKQVSSGFVALINALAVTAAAGGISWLFEDWTPISFREFWILALAAFFIFGGYLFAVSSMRVGETAAVTPFRYTIMLWAILLGWLFWEEVPDGLTLIGTAIVIFAGLFTLWRERQITSTSVPPPQPSQTRL